MAECEFPDMSCPPEFQLIQDYAICQAYCVPKMEAHCFENQVYDIDLGHCVCDEGYVIDPHSGTCMLPEHVPVGPVAPGQQPSIPVQPGVPAPGTVLPPTIPAPTPGVPPPAPLPVEPVPAVVKPVIDVRHVVIFLAAAGFGYVATRVFWPAEARAR